MASMACPIDRYPTPPALSTLEKFEFVPAGIMPPGYLGVDGAAEVAQMENSASIYFAPDGYLTDHQRLMGRHAAGEGFLRAFFQTARDPEFACCAPGELHDYGQRLCRSRLWSARG